MKKNMKEYCIKALRKMTRHENVFITNRCNLAILVALSIAKKNNPKKNILIPDQGGWFSFRKYPAFFGLNAKYIKTDMGLISKKALENALKKKDCCAFIMTSFAGYFAEQPIKDIAAVCHANGCLIIEDASGAIGDKKLCNGTFSDIIVGSFSENKPVNLGYGGFISFSKPEYYDKEIFSLIRINPEMYKKLLPKLKDAGRRLKKFLKLSKKVKKELKAYQIIHRDKRGLNVIVSYSDKPSKQAILEYCRKKGYDILLCPRYIRVQNKAVSMELKNLIL